jgi:DNA polymerase-3 subunit epsilon
VKVALFYDTETTGLPLFSEPSEDPRQPHIVQLGACLVDLDTRQTLASLDVIVKPEGWTIPAEVAAIHGITTEKAMAAGIPESLAVELLLELHKRADFRVAHNESFDSRILRIAYKRFFDEAVADEWKGGRTKCTQLLSTPILKLPPTAKMIAARRNHHKSANLGEAFKYFTGQELVGAHSAMVDVQACMAVYWAIQDLQSQPATT